MTVWYNFDFFERLESDYKEMSEGDKDRRRSQKEAGGEKIAEADKKVRQSFFVSILQVEKGR